MAIENDVLQTIKARRSMRKFTDEQIPPEQLGALLEAAIERRVAVTIRVGCSQRFRAKTYYKN